MKPFRFSLQAVLTVRERQEHVALEAYARAVEECLAARSRLEAARLELEAARGEWGRLMNAGCTAEAACAHRDHCVNLEHRELRQVANLEQRDRALQAAWQVLMTARQKRETVDRFQELQRERHEHELQVEEQKLLDEMAGRRLPAVEANPAETSTDLHRRP